MEILTEQDLVKIVKIFYDDFNRRDMDAAMAHFAEDVTYVDPWGNEHDKTGARALFESLKESFPDLKAWVNRAVSQGNTAMVECYESMTHTGDFFGIPPTNKKVEFQGAEIYEFQDGKVKHLRTYCNPNRILEYLRAE
jgi:steroid delta-isomerase-like uncharacterized protein